MADGLNPVLSWTKEDGTSLDGNVVLAGKSVWLLERWWGDETPQNSPLFTIHQIFGNILRRVLSHVGFAMERGDHPMVTQVSEDGRHIWSERAWSAAVPDGPRARAVYNFTNLSGSRSPRLVTHRVGDAEFKGELVGEVSGNVGVAKVGASGKGEVKIVVAVAVDPLMRCGLLLPWEADEASIDVFIREQIEEIEGVDTEEAMVAFRQAFELQLPRQKPEGWSLVIPEEAQPVEPGASSEFVIQVEAGTPYSTVFAVQVEDVDNPQNVICTEPLVLEVTEELDILVHYDTEEAEAVGPLASA